MKHELGARRAGRGSDLDLRRMDVDVHPARVDLEEKHVRGMAFSVQDVAIRLRAARARGKLVAHEPAVT